MIPAKHIIEYNMGNAAYVLHIPSKLTFHCSGFPTYEENLASAKERANAVISSLYIDYTDPNLVREFEREYIRFVRDVAATLRVDQVMSDTVVQGMLKVVNGTYASNITVSAFAGFRIGYNAAKENTE